MQNFDELRREAEETKERLRRDILELRDIFSRIAREGGDRGRTLAEESLKQAETRIEEAISQAEKRFETALAAVTGCNLNYDDFVTRELDIRDFANIEADCAFRVEIVQSGDFRVGIWASEALQKEVNAVKSGNTLKLSLKSHSFHARPIVEAKVSLPQLNRLRLGGAASATARGIESKGDLDLNLSGNSVLDIEAGAVALKCEISGASKVMGRVQVTNAEFVLSGASRLALTGSAEDVTLSGWGASKAETEGFKAENARLFLKGASEATIKANGQLDIDLSGGSRLTYSGNPTIHSISVTGASSLNHT